MCYIGDKEHSGGRTGETDYFSTKNQKSGIHRVSKDAHTASTNKHLT